MLCSSATYSLVCTTSILNGIGSSCLMLRPRLGMVVAKGDQLLYRSGLVSGCHALTNYIALGYEAAPFGFTDETHAA